MDSDESTFVHALLDEIRKKRKMAMKVYIVRQNIDKNELIFKCFLYEDKKPLSSNVTSGHKYVLATPLLRLFWVCDFN